MKEQPFVFKPYEANDFGEAVKIVNRQRCQRCEGKVRFNNQSTKPDNEGVCTLDGVCTECSNRHAIRVNIANIVIREA